MTSGDTDAVRNRREFFDRLAIAALALAVLVWIAYGWEATTGLTWATRHAPGRMSTADSLVQAKRTAIGVTAVALPLGLMYFVLFRRPEE